MQAFIVQTVARQIEGETIFIKSEKGFLSATKADAYAQELKLKYIEPDGKIKPQVMSTGSGTTICACEVTASIIEIDESL